jgi:actin-related protein 3
VESTTTQKYAAWFGGSCLAADPAFKDACHSRAHYMEHGARIVRSTQGFA